MSVLPLVSFVVIATAALAFALLFLMIHDEVKFQRQYRAANDAVIGAAMRAQPVRVASEPSSLPRAA
jgi:hypothetical protein